MVGHARFCLLCAMYVLRFTVWNTIIRVSDWKSDYFHIFSFVLRSVNWKVLEKFLFTHQVALKNLISFAALTHSFFFFWCMTTCEWKLFVHTFHDIISVSLNSKWFDLRVETIEMSVICMDKSASWDISYLDDQSACTWSTADAIVVTVRKRGSS